MSISKLSKDCLFLIFDLIYDLDDLINCYLVSHEWSQIISYRLSKVKYLEGLNTVRDPVPSALDTVSFRTTQKLRETNLAKLLPNIKVANILSPFNHKLNKNELESFLSNIGSLKGLIHDSGCFDDRLFSHCENLEWIASDNVNYLVRHGGCERINQLLLWNYYLDRFTEEAGHFPNLKRLNLFNEADRPEDFYDGPPLKNLVILELGLCSYDGTDEYVGFHLMDFCPLLESAFHYIDTSRHYIRPAIKNYNLRDLVIYHDKVRAQDWHLKMLLNKYPNLKHLALRNNIEVNDYVVESLVKCLPELVLMDFRGSLGVTQRSVDFLNDLRSKTGRDIKMYFKPGDKQIELDWPNLSSKAQRICKGMDFMKHCFLKEFHQLPEIMDIDVEAS